MPRNTDGTYILPSGNPVQPGTLITSVWGNTTFGDLANMLNGLCTADGKLGMTGQFRGQYVAPGTSNSVGWEDPATGFFIDGFSNGGGDYIQVHAYFVARGFWWTGKTEIKQNLTINGDLLQNGQGTPFYPFSDVWDLENGGSSAVPSGPGKMCFNNFTPLNATAIRIDKTSVSDHQAPYMWMAIGDLFTITWIANMSMYTAWSRWKVTGAPVDMGTYIEIPCDEAQSINTGPQVGDNHYVVWTPKR